MNQEPDSNNEAEAIPLEIAPIEQITRAEVSQQIATARAYPRNMTQFKQRALSMITLDQETAESCIYRLKRKDRNSPGGYKIIEGESIRMAEIVAATFGNLRSGVRIIGQTPTRVTVQGVCHDLETNNAVTVEKQARTTYSDGSPYNEDMAIVATNAVVSKALRDVIFRVVPKALVKPLKAEALKVAFGDGKAFAERRSRAIEWATKTRGVPLDRVLAALEVQSVDNMTIAHLEILTGLKTAIIDGDQSIEEAFPPIEGDSKPVMEHPAAKEQKKSNAKTKEQPPVTTGTVETPAKTAETTAAKTPDNVVPMKEPAKTTETPPSDPPPKDNPAAEPAKTTAPEPAPAETAPAQEAEPPKTTEPGELSQAQAKLKELVEGNGYTFAEFVAALEMVFAKAPPKDWSGVAEDKAALFVQTIKGILSRLASMKARKK